MNHISEDSLLNRKCMYVDRTSYLSGNDLQNALNEIQNASSIYNIDYSEKIISAFQTSASEKCRILSTEDIIKLIDLLEKVTAEDDTLIHVKKYLIKLKIVAKLLKFKIQFLNILDMRAIIRSFKNNIKNIVEEEDFKINISIDESINFKILVNEFQNRVISKNKLRTDTL
ncbi:MULTISPECIES: hypothetical protein [Chryseobacterium]|uniref:hypothetical protein n=1 Tax=Chryseobacterium TaxID=59732 RepID=UPI0004045C92|nr:MULTISPECIES: hypothetical protein [Chryseobacterium]WNI34705.1 hypothetical protein RHP76_12025 [Chryseobacterium sp. SG20098]